ncbi:MAG: cytochrome c [Ignavibacteriae bacterium]|nr:cytochrome c [Ignavibacteriota bacterium]
MDQRSDLKPEMDFRDMLRSPRKLFGYTYVYVLTVLVIIGILYVNRLDAIGRSTIVPVALKDSSAFVLEIPFQSPRVLPPVDVKLAVVPNDSVLAHGREVYRTACASCHGETGLGDGAAGLVLNPRPRNFHTANGWTNGARISDIYRTLQEGIVKNGMASYGYLPPADRFALIHLIRSFHPAPPVDSEADIANLETVYQLSKGTTIPAQVPIVNAMKSMVGEHVQAQNTIARALERFEASSDPGAMLFLRSAKNPTRVLQAIHARADRFAALDDFVRIVSYDPIDLGFHASVSRLSRENWVLLHRTLTGVGL